MRVGGVGKGWPRATFASALSPRAPRPATASLSLTFWLKLRRDRCRVAPPDPPPDRAMEVTRDEAAAGDRPNACEGAASGRGRPAGADVDSWRKRGEGDGVGFLRVSRLVWEALAMATGWGGGGGGGAWAWGGGGAERESFRPAACPLPPGEGARKKRRLVSGPRPAGPGRPNPAPLWVPGDAVGPGASLAARVAHIRPAVGPAAQAEKGARE